MTVKSIAEQIDAIRQATEKAAVSPETALEFLRRAGIVSPDKRKGKPTVKTSNASHRVTATLAVSQK